MESSLLDYIKKQASSFLQDKYKNARLALTDVTRAELLTEEATNNHPWGPDAKTMTKIAQASYDVDDYWRIVDILHKRFDVIDWKEWRQSYKTLVLVEFLLTHGPEEIAEEFQADCDIIEELGKFQYIDDKGEIVKILLSKLEKNNRLHFSASFHPQTDGQSERVIQVLEDMMRSCIIEFEGSWDKYLPLMEFAYNNSYQSSIQMAPHEALFNWGMNMQKRSDHVLRLLNGGITLKEARLKALKITKGIQGFGNVVTSPTSPSSSSSSSDSSRSASSSFFSYSPSSNSTSTTENDEFHSQRSSSFNDKSPKQCHVWNFPAIQEKGSLLDFEDDDDDQNEDTEDDENLHGSLLLTPKKYILNRYGDNNDSVKSFSAVGKLIKKRYDRQFDTGY